MGLHAKAHGKLASQVHQGIRDMWHVQEWEYHVGAGSVLPFVHGHLQQLQCHQECCARQGCLSILIELSCCSMRSIQILQSIVSIHEVRRFKRDVKCSYSTVGLTFAST